MNIILKKTNDNYYKNIIDNIKSNLSTSEILFTFILSIPFIYFTGFFGMIIIVLFLVLFMVRDKTLIPISKIYSIETMGKIQYYFLTVFIVAFFMLAFSNAKYNVENNFGSRNAEEQTVSYNVDSSDINDDITDKDNEKKKEVINGHSEIENLEKQIIEFNTPQLFAIHYLSNILLLWLIHIFTGFFLKSFLFQHIKGFNDIIDMKNVVEHVYADKHKQVYYRNTGFALIIISGISLFFPIISYSLITLYGSLYTINLVYNHLFVIEKENYTIENF